MPRTQRPNLRRAETSLYGPVKRYLETLGFIVKGEVCGCDLVALRGDEPPMVVVGELNETALGSKSKVAPLSPHSGTLG